MITPYAFRIGSYLYEFTFSTNASQNSIDDLQKALVKDSLAQLGTIFGAMALNTSLDMSDKTAMFIATLLILAGEKCAPMIAPAVQDSIQTVNSWLCPHMG